MSTAVTHGADLSAVESPAKLARLRTFHTLDALRGVAAFVIVLFHAAFFYGITPPAEGQLAVDLFFVMSGFIIAHRYDGDLRRGLSLARFVQLRLIRLYPLFLLGMVLGFIPALLAVMAGNTDPLHKGLVESFPLAILMLPSRFALPQIHEIYPLNYVAWSLALEIAINIVYAATFRFWTLRRLVVLIGAAVVGLCICVAVYGSLKYGYAWGQLPVGLVRVVFGFSAGVLICRLYHCGLVTVRVPWWALLVAAATLFFLDAPFARGEWELLAITVLVPAIAVGAVNNEPPKVLQGACALLGLFSYAVYSLHAPFIGFFLRGESRAHLDISVQTPFEAFVFTVLLVALCVAAHLFYDRPVRRFLTARMAARAAWRGASPASASANR